jgi:hypothetical protein
LNRISIVNNDSFYRERILDLSSREGILSFPQGRCLVIGRGSPHSRKEPDFESLRDTFSEACFVLIDVVGWGVLGKGIRHQYGGRKKLSRVGF